MLVMAKQNVFEGFLWRGYLVTFESNPCSNLLFFTVCESCAFPLSWGVPRRNTVGLWVSRATCLMIQVPTGFVLALPQCERDPRLDPALSKQIELRKGEEPQTKLCKARPTPDESFRLLSLGSAHIAYGNGRALVVGSRFAPRRGGRVLISRSRRVRLRQVTREGRWWDVRKRIRPHLASGTSPDMTTPHGLPELGFRLVEEIMRQVRITKSRTPRAREIFFYRIKPTVVFDNNYNEIPERGRVSRCKLCIANAFHY